MRNYLSEMLYELTSAYTRKDYNNCQHGLPLETNIGKLFSLFAWGLNLAKKQAELVKLWDDIDYACGSVLDRYGANFGVKRLTPDDRFYRLAIKVKVMAQLSGGDINTVIQAAAALLDVDFSEILLEDVYPAKIALYVNRKLLSQERLDLIEEIAYAIKRILAAGVGMHIYLRVYRTYRYNLMFTHFGYVDNRVSSLSINQFGEMKRTMLSHNGGATGTIYHVHIKSKRME